MNSSNCGAMRLLRSLSASLSVSSCRDLSDVRTGAPIPPSSYRRCGSESLETSQKTSRGVLRRIIKESKIDIDCKVRCVRLSHWILTLSIGKSRGWLSPTVDKLAEIPNNS